MDLARSVLQENNVVFSPLYASQLLQNAQLAHLETMFSETKTGPIFKLNKGNFVTQQDVINNLEKADELYQALRRGQRGEKMTNYLLDWALLGLYNLDGNPNVRIVSVQMYDVLRKRYLAVEAKTKTSILPTDQAVKSLLRDESNVDPSTERKLRGAALLAKLEGLEEVAKMQKIAGTTERPLLNHKDGVYAAIVCLHDGIHFSFIVLDSEHAEGVSSPKLVYFDSRESNVNPRMDANIIALANVAEMANPPSYEVLGVDQADSDEWSCGYRTVDRARKVVRWLTNNRAYKKGRLVLNSETPIADSGADFLMNIDNNRCGAIIRDIRYLTALALVYMDSRYNSMTD